MLHTPRAARIGRSDRGVVDLDKPGPLGRAVAAHSVVVDTWDVVGRYAVTPLLAGERGDRLVAATSGLMGGEVALFGRTGRR